MRRSATKSLELAWRRSLIAAINLTLRRGAAGGPPDWNARPYRVLFLRHDKIGDMIVSTGAIRAIATAHPNIQLDVLASPGNAAVLVGTPHVHAIVPFDRRRPGGYVDAFRRLRRARYDCVVDCMVTAPSLTTLLLMVATAAPVRVGIAGRGNEDAYTVAVPPAAGTHMVDQLAALARAFGVDPTTADHRPQLYLTPDERARAERVWAEAAAPPGTRLLVNVSASKASCRWTAEGFVAALREVRARHPALRVVVIGAPDDRAEVEGIAAAVEAGAACPPLRDAFAMVASADLLLTPDTSIVHVASAFARPTVVTGPQHYTALWGLYDAPGRYVAVSDRGADVPPDRVVAALDALIAERAGGGAGQAAPDPGAGPDAAGVGAAR